MRGMRFAVELKYLGVRKKPVKTKPASTLSITNPSARLTVQLEVDTPTFAIINLCQLAPLGQVYEELKTFRASFISQNRLLFCKNKLIEVPSLPLSEIQRLAYADFDSFMRETIRYILDKRIFNVQQKRNHFCCELQNLTNILLKVIGSDFNTRMRTSSSVEFSVSLIHNAY